MNKQSGGGEKAGGSGRSTRPETRKAARKSSARRAAATRRGVPRPGSTLASMSKAELMDRARKRNIAGRSKMRKQELIEALRKAR
ncbi:hypothetical protein FQZ97_1091110 [compost metagenome]